MRSIYTHAAILKQRGSEWMTQLRKMSSRGSSGRGRQRRADQRVTCQHPIRPRGKEDRSRSEAIERRDSCGVGVHAESKRAKRGKEEREASAVIVQKPSSICRLLSGSDESNSSNSTSSLSMRPVTFLPSAVMLRGKVCTGTARRREARSQIANQIFARCINTVMQSLRFRVHSLR